MIQPNMVKERVISLPSVMIDDMVISLLKNCYNLNYADITSYFYQLTIQALQSEPNIVGPLKPPTGRKIKTGEGKIYDICKRVDTPQEVECSIWVIRGFYPETGIPYKMTVWYSDKTYGEISGSKVVMGAFGNRNKFTHINSEKTRQYVEEVAEKTLLDETVDESKKPTDYKEKKRTFRCMSPRGLTPQKRKQDGLRVSKRAKKIYKQQSSLQEMDTY